LPLPPGYAQSERGLQEAEYKPVYKKVQGLSEIGTGTILFLCEKYPVCRGGSINDGHTFPGFPVLLCISSVSEK
jgi:hypothetical protein